MNHRQAEKSGNVDHSDLPTAKNKLIIAGNFIMLYDFIPTFGLFPPIKNNEIMPGLE
jgi:hypothetical protein